MLVSPYLCPSPLWSPTRLPESPPPAQQAALEEAENRVIRIRRDTNVDVDSRISAALDAEASTLAQIAQEENDQKLRDLPRSSQPVSYLLSYEDCTNIMKDHYKR